MLKTILIVICVWVWGLFFWFSSAMANDYNKAVIGHVIQTEIQGNSVDTSVLEAEIQKIAHTFSLEMISAFEKHLPSILDSISINERKRIYYENERIYNNLQNCLGQLSRKNNVIKLFR